MCGASGWNTLGPLFRGIVPRERGIEICLLLCPSLEIPPYTSSLYFSIWCLDKAELPQYFNQCHFGFQESKAHTYAAPGPMPKGHMTQWGPLGLLLSCEPEKLMLATVWNLRIKGTLGPAILPLIERLPSSQRFKKCTCYGKGVQSSY